MTLLANIPIFVYYVIMFVTFLVVHAVAFDPRRVTTRGAVATTTMRVGSSVLLLLALIVMQPAEPVTLLLALALSAVGGYLSGRASPPPRQREPSEAEAGSKSEASSGSDAAPESNEARDA